MALAVVIGSAGLIGSETVRFFASFGFDVVGIDNDMQHPQRRGLGVLYPKWRPKDNLRALLEDIYARNVERWIAAQRF